MMLSVKSLLRNALFRSAAKKNSAIFSVSANFTRSAPIAAVNYESAYGVVFGEENPEVAFLGTGPMALSMAANIVKSATNEGVSPPKVVLLTEQDSYYNALKSNGFKVVDERDGSVINVGADQLIVVKSVDEYKSVSQSHPQMIFGTMQMGQKVDRWDLVQIAKERANGAKITVLTAANGIPFSTMLEKVGDNGAVNIGHATLYAKGRVDFNDSQITVTTTDHGKISVGAVGEHKNAEHFGMVKTIMEGPVYSVEVSNDAASEAMNKVIRNLTNCICLGLTTAQYHISGSTSDVKAMAYGAHIKKAVFFNTLNKATYQAGRALGLSPKECAQQIVENLKYVLGPSASKIDLDYVLNRFEEGLTEIKTLEKQKNSSAETRSRMFNELSSSISKKMRKKLYDQVGSTHPPTDAQAAALAAPKVGYFGKFIPNKPIENKITELIRLGEKRNCQHSHMDVLYAFSEIYDAYNKAVKNQTVFKMPKSFFDVIEEGDNEARLLANVDPRVLKLDWRRAEIGNSNGISVAAMRKQWLGESAIRNAKLIAELTKKGFTFLRYDVGGVGLPEAEAVIQARKDLAAGNNKYSPIAEREVLESLAGFYTETGSGRKFKPSEVMVLGVRAKGALPWMLDFVGNGPVFVPRPTYNPNPSAGLFHHREVLSFDITGPHRYAPMIEAVARHKGAGLIVLPIIGNPFSTTLSEEEEQGFIDILHNNKVMGFFGDHAYRGYNIYKDASGKIQNIAPTRDVMEKGGFYDESPNDPVSGEMRNFRVTTHSSSKLFNDASGSGTVAAHKHTISFLGDMLRGSFTQAHQRDRRTIPAIVENIDFDAPRRWMGAMNEFDKIVASRVPGFRDLGADCPPFKCYEATEWLRRHDFRPEEAQHYFMSRSPGLCGIFGGFGPGSNEIFRLGFTGEAPERASLCAEKFVEYANDEEAIAKFKAREDENTKAFFIALEEIQKAEENV